VRLRSLSARRWRYCSAKVVHSSASSYLLQPDFGWDVPFAVWRWGIRLLMTQKPPKTGQPMFLF
jgi:hypothetical protein